MQVEKIKYNDSVIQILDVSGAMLGKIDGGPYKVIVFRF